MEIHLPYSPTLYAPHFSKVGPIFCCRCFFRPSVLWNKLEMLQWEKKKMDYLSYM